MSNISFVFDEFAKSMVEALEEAKTKEKPILPWQVPYNLQNMPQNPVTKNIYRGINVINLGLAPFASPYWVTFANIKQIEGKIKPQESKKYRHVIFSKKYTPKAKEGETVDEGSKPRTKFIFQYTLVWNTQQLESWDESKLKLPELKTIEFNPIESAETIVSKYQGPNIIPDSTLVPYYRPSTDAVYMPPKDSFLSEQRYYSTLFHELGHSTGHKSRLNRDGIAKFDRMGSHRYSFEELIAEFCAAGLCGYTGIEDTTLDNSLAYIDHWSQSIKSDQDAFIKAVSQAQKAFDMIIGRETNFE